MPVSRRWTVPSYVATFLTWFGVATTSFVVLTVLLDWSPAPSVIAAQGLLPLIVVVALGVVAVSAIRRDWIPALAALAPTIAGSVLVVSVTTPAAEPAWAASSARLTVFASNVLKSNRDPDAGLRAAVESDADVVVLSEMTVRFEAALQRSGLLQRYPTLVRETDNVLLTRLPVADQGIRRHGGVDLPSATVIVGGRKVLVLAVHTSAPHARGTIDTWEREFDAIDRVAADADDVIAIGDFNAGPWNGPFRRLLDRGFVDAHDDLGHGLSRTWGPRQFGLDGAVRLLGIDHSLSRGQLAPESIVDVEVAGSDHRGISATYAVRSDLTGPGAG